MDLIQVGIATQGVVAPEHRAVCFWRAGGGEVRPRCNEWVPPVPYGATYGSSLSLEQLQISWAHVGDEVLRQSNRRQENAVVF